ncbi:DNA-directed RNA polymerase III subunit RPC4 isoform X1 [Bicyclus anynana]|uniref:DNA-directed RNA polymerase III subunit RPC4 isoform X1 n=1 Tax=Bicyclus anynana TaxID=110368 RepID=A0A6J1P859_BICAN|nr:DNA-directed RNA polymerase III subunit RPC4 isoform X1 [Bicyclus anynana]
MGDKSNVNGVGEDPLQRLASLKPPRDLSLGGMKPNKKIFTPNLNVARNKNKGPSTTNSRDEKKNDRNRRDRKNDKNRNNKNGPKIIKSSGVFSEGLANAERHSSRVSYGRETDVTATLQKPTIRVKDVVKIDKELEEEKIRAAFGDGASYEGDSEDFRNVLDVETPVKLPMDDGGLSYIKSGVKIKQEVVVKQEPTDDGDIPIVEQKPPLLDMKESFEENNVADLLRSDKPALILLQLADTLPGRGGGREEGARRKDQPAPSSSTEEEDKNVDNRCQLSDLEEGKIGKLRVHRSGRVTLCLGDTIFEVCSGTKASFHQEVVSVATDEASRSACLVSLGALQHKLNISPHWPDIFRDLTI